MSPKLKPLLLPQLVEERRNRERLEEQQLQLQQNEVAAPADNSSFDRDLAHIYYTTTSTSSSDLGSPVTPTFSVRGHARYSSSSSSLELMTPSTNDSPSSPTQVAHVKSSSKRQLPDVQEDPMEREDETDTTVLPDHFGLYDCLCDDYCVHGGGDLIQSEIHLQAHLQEDIDYDLGFLSDGDLQTSPSRFAKKRRGGGSQSSLSGLTARIGSRFPTLARWRSSDKHANSTNLASSPPASESALSMENEQRHSGSRGPSSRSSSLSAPGRTMPDRNHEPPLPPTPALSFYESTESVDLPTALDIEKANARESIERDRAMATTPLLPPLMTDLMTSQQPQESPLQSPSVAAASNPAASEVNLVLTQQPPCHVASPVLSTKPSVSSFRFSPGPNGMDMASPMGILPPPDAWSDLLGHNNYTITPKPYTPEGEQLETLQVLQRDWKQAQINYTKHLVRTGEHYGTTSKTYKLTEAKWAETVRQWEKAHEIVLERIMATSYGSGDKAAVASADVHATLRWRQLQDSAPSAVPRMLNAEKFPALGDEDIVGPMTRDTVMVRDGSDDRKHGVSTFWKSLAGKVGLRR